MASCCSDYLFRRFGIVNVFLHIQRAVLITGGQETSLTRDEITVKSDNRKPRSHLLTTLRGRGYNECYMYAMELQCQTFPCDKYLPSLTKPRDIAVLYTTYSEGTNNLIGVSSTMPWSEPFAAAVTF
jgi:hypothetical protein